MSKSTKLLESFKVQEFKLPKYKLGERIPYEGDRVYIVATKVGARDLNIPEYLVSRKLEDPSHDALKFDWIPEDELM